MMSFRTIRFFAALPMIALALPGSLRAHAGPPFPIVHEQPIPGYKASLWTDPDIGQSTFFVVLEPDKTASHPVVTAVDITIRPASGRLPPVSSRTTREQARATQIFTAHPELDVQEIWKVDAAIHMADGTVQALASEVEATPPGGGRWGLLFFLVPFLLFGGLWVLVFLRRSGIASARARGTCPTTSTAPANHRSSEKTSP